MDNRRTKGSTYGIGLFCIALLSRWSTGNALFIGTEGLLRFGVVEMLTFSLAGFFAFMTLIPIARRLANIDSSSSLLDILEYRLSHRANVWMKKLLLIGLFFNLCLLGYSAGIILYSFSIPVYAGMSLFFFFGLVLAAGLKLKWFTRYSMIKVGIVFLLMIMLLVHSYLLEGIQVVYDGVSLYHPYLLFISWDRFPLLLAAFWCVMFGFLLTDLKTWGVILRHKGAKKELGLVVTGFLWGTIPFSFAMISFSAIYLGGFSSILAVFQRIFTRYDQLSVTLLLVGLILFIITDTFLSGLRALFIFYDRKELKINSRFWLLGLIFVVVIPFGVKMFSFSILDLFFLFGSFFAACVPVISYLLWQNKVQGMSFVIAIMAATITGWILYFLGIYEYSVLGSFSLALASTVLFHFVFQQKKIIDLIRE